MGSLTGLPPHGRKARAVAIRQDSESLTSAEQRAKLCENDAVEVWRVMWVYLKESVNLLQSSSNCLFFSFKLVIIKHKSYIYINLHAQRLSGYHQKRFGMISIKACSTSAHR